MPDVPNMASARVLVDSDGPGGKALRSRAGDGVRFVGQRPDVADWLAAANVVTLPSRWEGMSIGMLEAMARGRSVVATDVPGAEEALDREAGALVPPEDSAALADALADRLLDPDQTAVEGRAARMRAERSHDLGKMTNAIAALYEEVLALSSSTEPKTL